MTARSPAEVRAVTIFLENYSLTVVRRSFQGWRWKLQNLPILKPVTASFDPGTLNVIMLVMIEHVFTICSDYL
jgi:hypothetical protein